MLTGSETGVDRLAADATVESLPHRPNPVAVQRFLESNVAKARARLARGVPNKYGSKPRSRKTG
jgi:hypothetical protein